MLTFLRFVQKIIIATCAIAQMKDYFAQIISYTKRICEK